LRTGWSLKDLPATLNGRDIFFTARELKVWAVTSFSIDPDITKARTLPSAFYTSDDVFEAVREKIFARAWHFAGGPERKEIATPVLLLPEYLDEPVLLVDHGGEALCVSNVCTHRGKILVEAPCSPDLIRCRYHGRRFALDGSFISMPEFQGVEGFPSPSDDLKRVPTAEWLGFRFVSIDPFAAFGELLPDKLDVLALSGELELVSQREYEVKAHWALYCENYLEGFHIPYVHRSLNAVVDYGTYSTETYRYSSLQTGYDANGAAAGRYLFIFPNLMFNFYPWGVSVNIVEPRARDRTVVRFLSYVGDPSKVDEGAGADLHSVEMEDEAVVESVQKGIRSRFYTSGRYSPSREQGTHHFHRLIAEFLG
jgi:choline monooxygenase